MSYLYVLELSDGLIKVGRSINPSRRWQQQSCHLGRTILKNVYFKCYVDPRFAERYLVKMCCQHMVVRPFNELFYGLSFTQVWGWAEAASVGSLSVPRPLKPTDKKFSAEWGALMNRCKAKALEME